MVRKAKALAKPSDINPTLMATIAILGLSPIALALSLAIALAVHMVH